MCDVQPEIKDINEMINRFHAINRGGAAFICGFVAFDEEGQCREDANFLRMFGHHKELEQMLKDIKKMMSKFRDKEGFVNL